MQTLFGTFQSRLIVIIMISVLLSKVEIREVLFCSTSQISVISMFLCIFISFVYSYVLFQCMTLNLYLNFNGFQYSIKQLNIFVLFIIFTCNNKHLQSTKYLFVFIIFYFLYLPTPFCSSTPLFCCVPLYIFTRLPLNFREGNTVLDQQPEYMFR